MDYVNSIPFTIDQFLNVFQRYNVAVWPAQVVLYALGLLTVGLALQRRINPTRSINFVLALLWLWMGIVYHLLFFSSINKAANVFGAFFILQAFVFIFVGVKAKLVFRFKPNAYGITGAIFFLYALVAYPVFGYLVGHQYPTAPTFGLPCPTTIFTFGMLLWTEGRVPIYVLILPLIWSLIGFWAAVALMITEDFGLLLAGLIGSLLIIYRNFKRGVAQEVTRASA